MFFICGDDMSIANMNYHQVTYKINALIVLCYICYSDLKYFKFVLLNYIDSYVPIS